MQQAISIKARLVTLLVAVVSVSACAEETLRIPVPDDLFYYSPAATAHGSEAVWINPAGLGRLSYTSIQLIADHYEGDYGKSWAMASNRQQVGFAYRYIHNPAGTNYREYIYAVGMGHNDGIQAGFSYRYFKDGPGFYNNRHFWNIGLSGTSQDKIRWAAVFSNLNRGRIEGARTETEMRYSVSYRPKGKLLTLAADMFLSTKTRLSNAEFVYHARVEPKPGLYLDGYVDSHRNFQVGVRVNLLKYFVGARGNVDRGGQYGRSTVYVGVTDQRQPSLISEPRRRLALGLRGRPAENPPRPIIGRKRTPFSDIVAAIYRAADDRSVDEMLLTLRGLSLGFGQAQEIREALSYFRSQGKRISAYLISPGNISYYVASVCNAIFVPPVTQLRLVGLRAELSFYASTLEKLGVRIELLREGEYKTAVEKYTRSAASEENRAQINRLLDRLYDQFAQAIADGRGISTDSVKLIIDRGPFTSVEALESGLIDGICYAEDLREEYLGERREVSFRQFRSDTLLNDDWRPLPVLAVVVADGEIVPEAGGVLPTDRSNQVTPNVMRRAFARTQADADVKAVILRINSPGGSALASEDIYHAAMRLAEKKPLIVSMGNVAASGGYYVAMAAERLFANTGTVTGSIGIYGGKADLSGLHRKIALGKELYVRGKHAGMLSMSRPFTDDERAKFQSHLSAFYSHFLDLVVANRSLPQDSVDGLGRGQVWTGDEAVNCGLVDDIGGLRQALEHTAGLLDLKDYRVRIYPEKRPLFVFPGRSIMRRFVSLLTGTPSEDVLPDLSSILSEDGYLLARMPYDIVIE